MILHAGYYSIFQIIQIKSISMSPTGSEQSHKHNKIATPYPQNKTKQKL